MTFTVTKTKLALAVVVMALLVPATAFATHSFTDAPDDKYYTDAVAWAKANGMTTGCGDGTTFCPEDPVTRGQNITFAHRYDDLVVQPALATLTSDVAAMPTVYTVQVGSDCAVLNQSGGLIVVDNALADNVCDVGFPTSVDTCTIHASPALFGMGSEWTPVGEAYAIDPPIIMTQLWEGMSIRVHQYLSSGSTTPGNEVSFNLSVICA